MASRTSRAKPIPLAEFAAGLQKRRETVGNPEMPRNSGNRRTPSQRALLAAIEAAGGTW